MSFEVGETVVEEGGKQQMNYSHRLVAGPTAVQNYGLRFAENSGLPTDVLEEAREMGEKMPAIYEAPMANEHLELSREKLTLKASGVLRRLYFSGELTTETAKQVKEFFWAAVEELPKEEEEAQHFRPDDSYGALAFLQGYMSPVSESERRYDSEDGDFEHGSDREDVDVGHGSYRGDVDVEHGSHREDVDVGHGSCSEDVDVGHGSCSEDVDVGHGSHREDVDVGVGSDSEDASMSMDEDVTNHHMEFSFQSDTTVRLYEDPTADAENAVEDEGSEDDEDDEDDESDIFEELMKRHEQMYQNSPWNHSHGYCPSVDSGPSGTPSVTPRPAWGLFNSSATIGRGQPCAPSFLPNAAPAIHPAESWRVPVAEIPAFQRVLRTLYQSPSEKEHA